jgi:hypothetical protein
MLVGTNARKDRVMDADYHVAEGDGDKPGGERQKRSDLKKLAAGHFNATLDKTECCPS